MALTPQALDYDTYGGSAEGIIDVRRERRKEGRIGRHRGERERGKEREIGK